MSCSQFKDAEPTGRVMCRRVMGYVSLIEHCDRQTNETYDDLVDGGVSGEDSLGAWSQVSQRGAETVDGGRTASTSPTVKHLSRDPDWQQDDHSPEHADQCCHHVPRPLAVQRARHHLSRRSVFSPDLPNCKSSCSNPAETNRVYWKMALKYRIEKCRNRNGWLRDTVVERRSLAGELFLSCARPVAEGWPLMWVNRPL